MSTVQETQKRKLENTKLPDTDEEKAREDQKGFKFKCSLPRFSGKDEDWESWKFNLGSFCQFYGLQDMLKLGKEGKYGEKVGDKKKREFCAAIGASLEERAIRVVRHVAPGDGGEMIRNLVERYEPRQASVRRDLLYKVLKPRFNRKSNASITDLITEMEKAKHDLEACFNIIMPEDVLSFSLVEEMQKHSEFSAAKDLWVHKEDVSWSDVCSIMKRLNSNFAFIREDDGEQVAALQDSERSRIDELSEEVAFLRKGYGKGGKGKGGKGKGGGKGQKGKGQGDRDCYRCGRHGHFARECWATYHKDGQRLEKVEEQKVDTMVMGVCREHESVAAVNRNSTNHSERWLIDSGATVHICRNKDMFNVYKEEQIPLRVADGKAVYALGVGEVQATICGRKVRLRDVLHCPDMMYNILSVPALVEHNHVVTFTREGGSIREFGTGKVYPVHKGKDGRHFWASEFVGMQVMTLGGFQRLETAESLKNMC